jgi:valyl-tRNA synthetase
MEKSYNSAETEAHWYARWQELRCFQPDVEPGKPAYSITIPPPNVTGSLHMGHALCYTIQDILGRWKRMGGHNVLILPGVDHAGIATQNVVEKEIAQEGLTRHDLGREKFLERVWTWKERYGARIVLQMQRLGCAFDWSRERFTMDDDYVEAIQEEFIRLFDQGLIYRGARVINWCPRCMTALSDIEVEYVERDSNLWHIRYPFADGNGEIVVATTRPETMLGDTAVAVNPKDERYAGMQGRMLTLPLTEREITLIFDDYASMEFGTGAVKVTPAHDLNDYEAGRRHKLPMIVVIGEDGRMTASAGDRYANLTREEARERVERDLEEQGFLVRKEPYRHSVGTCERCHTIIEPLLSEQWFVKMAGTPMVEKAIQVVKDDKITFAPERYKRVYVDWMENIRDWCISRQLWWGHRIPIYYAPDGSFTAARSSEEAAGKLGLEEATHLRQDEDVLDTWFSSALWPFATLGWPRETDDLKTFYPTSVLTTAREILYLWVARMIMTGEEFLGEIPFHEVYIYATVLDKQGRRMSKSLGNGVDPIEMIDKYGADALRFSLVRLASKGQDIRFSEDRIPEARNFCTKIWNAARFVLMSLEGPLSPAGGGTGGPPFPNSGGAGEEEISAAERFSGAPRVGGRGPAFTIPERWILTRLQHTGTKMGAAFASYDMDDACTAIHEFFWSDYCDWFLELAKPALRSDDVAAKARVKWVLWHVLETALRLLHPIIPFETEEIWQSIPHDGETIMHAAYPIADLSLINEAAAQQMETVIASIRAVRAARGELKIVPSLAIDAVIVADADQRVLLEENLVTLQSLARLGSVEFADVPLTGEGVVVIPVQSGIDVYLPLAGTVDMEKELARISSELANVEKDIEKVAKKLSNPMFIEKAAPDIVARDRANAAELAERKAKLEARRAALGG